MGKDLIILIFLISILTGCGSQKSRVKEFRTVGRIERLNPIINDIIPEDAEIEVLAEGLTWSEGPIWRADEKKLIFTDVRVGKLYQWTEEEGLSLYLDVEEPKNKIGPSALLVNSEDELIMLRYGHGEVVKMKSSIDKPLMDFDVIASTYEGKRFNHTNDAAFHSNGDLYMSDPPPSGNNGLKAGVYRISPEGNVSLITDSLSSPNGVAFSPDEKTIYIANADWQHAIWIAADVDESGNVSNGRVIFDATGNAPKEKGHPDGLKVSSKGMVFATGPGGVYVLDAEGKHLGTILNDEFNTNCVLDDKEEALYITSGPYLMRVRLK